MIGWLGSYAYFKKDNIATLKSRLYGAPLFADSGAFSMHHLGLDLRISDYAKWLLKAYDKWEVYANLDVIFNPEKTYANQKFLESKGLKPMPVIHYGTNPSEVQKYIDEGHDYIALGGMANRTSEDPTLVAKWGEDCFKVASDQAVFHGFGFIRQNLLLELPWYSVDSSSWNGAERYGTGVVFTNNELKTVSFTNKDHIAKYADVIQEHGGNLMRFLDGNHSYRDSTEVSVVAYKKLADWWSMKSPKITRHNTPNAVVGPIIYLAGSTGMQIGRGAFTLEKYRRANK